MKKIILLLQYCNSMNNYIRIITINNFHSDRVEQLLQCQKLNDDCRAFCLTHQLLYSLRSKRFRGKFRCFSHAKVGARAKKRKRGEGERREGNACRQTPGIWKTRSPANGVRDWLGSGPYYWHVPIKALILPEYSQRVEISCLEFLKF